MLVPNCFPAVPDRLSGERYGMVTYKVVSDTSLSANARLLYSVLSTYISMESGECWPAITTLADCMNCSQRTISRSMKELQSRNVIRRYKGSKQSKTTMLLK